jgi:hypothetical protein
MLDYHLKIHTLEEELTCSSRAANRWLRPLLDALQLNFYQVKKIVMTLSRFHANNRASHSSGQGAGMACRAGGAGPSRPARAKARATEGQSVTVSAGVRARESLRPQPPPGRLSPGLGPPASPAGPYKYGPGTIILSSHHGIAIRIKFAD